MKGIIKKLLLYFGAIASSFVIGIVFISTFSNAATVKLGVQGSYMENPSDYIKRVNEIRKEACVKGYKDPRDEFRKLTPEDYVPLKWSSELQEIARIRAAEASIKTAHERPKGGYVFDIKSSTGIQAYSEILAWGDDGIKLWYTEKNDWIYDGPGQTGHYASLINPSNRYIAISYFYSTNGVFTKNFAGALSHEKNLDSSELKNISNVTVPIEVDKNGLSSVKIDIEKKSLKKGKSTVGRVVYSFGGKKNRLFYLGSVVWKSSNTKVATIDNKGFIRLKKYGTTTFSARLENGTRCSIKQSFKAPSEPTKLVYVKGKKAAITSKWKKGNSATVRYRLQFCTNKKFNGAYLYFDVKGRNKTKLTLGGFKRKKKYYVRIRTFNKKGDMSSWSKAMSVKVK